MKNRKDQPETAPRKKTFFYRCVVVLARILFPRAKTVYAEPPGDHPSVFISNHAGMRGPVLMTLYFDRPH